MLSEYVQNTSWMAGTVRTSTSFPECICQISRIMVVPVTMPWWQDQGCCRVRTQHVYFTRLFRFLRIKCTDNPEQVIAASI